MKELSGLGKIERKRLTDLIRQTKGVISVEDAANILRMERGAVAKMLSKWATKGWLSRIRRGLYVVVPIESRTADVPIEDPWLIASYLYEPCYIGGWSAAEYWDLTDQIFRSVFVMTTREQRGRTLFIKNTKFVVRMVNEKTMFGLKPIWKGKMKIFVSDPTRTLIDLFNDPSLGGGIRPTFDVFRTYLKSEYIDKELTIDYAKRFGNGAVFKRLGYLMEYIDPNENIIISACKALLTKGNAKLDPNLPSEKLITRWRLWVPINWAMGYRND